MSSQEELQNKLRAGVEAAKRGDRTTARRLLEAVIEVDENNELAWIWLASAVSTAAERRACLERVLQINPNNARAKEAMVRLGQETARTDPAADQARVRQQLSQVRRMQEVTGSEPGAARTQRGNRNASDGGSTLLIVVLLIALGVGAFLLINTLNQVINTPTPTPTVVVVAPATGTDVPSETPEPSATPTPQNRSAAEVTRQFAPPLPPVFTATFTLSPSNTPTPTITPPGLDVYQLLYISLNSGAVQPDAYIINADGSNEGLLLDQARDVALDASGLLMVFIRDVEVNGTFVPEVFIASADGSDPGTQLTSLGAPDTAHPSFSPDGTKIVFASSGLRAPLEAADTADTETTDAGADAAVEAPLALNADEELWLMNVDGSDLRQLTDNDAIDREPAFSPVDNTLIAFTSDAESPGFTAIHLLRLSPSSGNVAEVRRLASSSGSNYSPAWSQNGQWIVFGGDRSASGDIYIVNALTGGPGDLVTLADGSVENRRPAISGDGRLVAFISNREDDRFQTYVIRVGETNAVRVTNNERDDVSVIFRPLPPDLVPTVAAP